MICRIVVVFTSDDSGATMSLADPDRMARELYAATRQGAASDELGEAVSRALKAVAHDALYLAATCPAAGFGPESFSFWHAVEADLGRALLRDYHAGVHPYQPEDLAGLAVPAGVIGAGDRRVRRLFDAHGVGCELRMLLRDARGTWGTLGLLRTEGGRPFDGDDIARAARSVPALAKVVRGYVTAGRLTPVIPAPPPGVVILGPDHTIRSATAQARALQGRMDGDHTSPDWVFRSFLSGLSMRARRAGAEPVVAFGPAASYGRWMVCEAQPLDGDATGDVAVIIQSADGERLLPHFCDWYGITPRERQVITHLRDASAAKHIARRLGVSVYTVNDHLKAVYRKTGAGSHDELLAAITN
ncbi:helix-turn-helix transcriptional regulator [Actinoallomurus sp. NPDC050550]|uniref:helix-turn-helix transcriptional regulator n=1 Tax=Actinoallomurus sp. NPDC050550 TaxID=3154937 RepID=UPI0033DD0BE5